MHHPSREAHVEQKVASLTPRECEGLVTPVEGEANKLIAYLLGASTRTIENHHPKIMPKMQAESRPDLVRMVLSTDAPSSVKPGEPLTPG